MPRKRDQLAAGIFKAFLSPHSKYQIPDDISDLLEEFPDELNNGEQLRPTSSLLEKVKMMAEDFLVPAIKEFLQKEGKVPQDEIPIKPVSRKVTLIYNIGLCVCLSVHMQFMYVCMYLCMYELYSLNNYVCSDFNRIRCGLHKYNRKKHAYMRTHAFYNANQLLHLNMNE